MEGNEAADVRAKEGVARTLLTLKHQYVQKSINFWMYEKHQCRCPTDTCRTAKKAMPVIKPKIGKQAFALSRNNLRLLLQAITGHRNLGRHNYKTGKTTNPNCPKCNEEPETSEHHVGRCPRYYQTRASIFLAYETTLETVIQEWKLTLKRLVG